MSLTPDSLFFSSSTFILCLSLVVLNSKILLLIDIQFYHTVHKFHYLLLTTICLLTEYKIRTNKLENPINFLISHKSIRYIQFIQISPICPRKRERKKERERNPRAIKRSYGDLGQFLDWPEPVQERRNERNRETGQRGNGRLLFTKRCRPR